MIPCLKPLTILLGISFFASSAHAAFIGNPKLLDQAPKVSEVSKKHEIHVNADDISGYSPNEIMVVVRAVPDPLRPGADKLKVVGRAAVIDSSSSSVNLIFYRSFESAEPKPGDRLIPTGDPLTAADMDMIRKEKLGILHQDKELSDYYHGLIALKFGVFKGRLSSTSSNDTNAAKSSSSFMMTSFGLRWWSRFAPRWGVNFDYSSGGIPTLGFHQEVEQSSQTYINPGVLYRGRLFVVPTIWTLTYFVNSFKTTNPDDFLISSTYSGFDVGGTFYVPWAIHLLRGKTQVSIENPQLGFGYAPSVSVSDVNYQRGTSVSGYQLALHAGFALNIAVQKVPFTRNLFVVFEGGMQKYDLQFSGATTGTIPFEGPIPENGHNTETQTWYGIRLKYELPDLIGNMFADD